MCSLVLFTNIRCTLLLVLSASPLALGVLEHNQGIFLPWLYRVDVEHL